MAHTVCVLKEQMKKINKTPPPSEHTTKSTTTKLPRQTRDDVSHKPHELAQARSRL